MVAARKIIKKNIKNALKKEKKTILKGLPGVGKSSLCFEICKELNCGFVVIDCEYDLEFLNNIIIAMNSQNFRFEFLKMCVLTENNLDNTVFVFENIECSDLFCKSIYYRLVEEGLILLMTMRVSNKRTFKIENECKCNILRPSGFYQTIEKLGKNDYQGIIEGNTRNVNPLPGVIHRNLEQECESFMLYGGMPQAVDIFKGSESGYDELKSIHDASSIYVLEKLLDLSDLDITEKNHCRQIVQSMFMQMLYSDYSRYMLKEVRMGATYSLYKNAIDFLVNNNYLYRCNNVSNEKSFALYFYDCGILYTKLLQLSNKLGILGAQDQINRIVRKNYVYIELLEAGIHPYSWKSEYKASIDFIFEKNNREYVCKVLDYMGKKDKSLDFYPLDDSKEYTLIKISEGNFDSGEKKYNIPYYAISCIPEIST